MTNPNETMRPNRPLDAFRAGARAAAMVGVAALLVAATLPGCGEEEPPPPGGFDAPRKSPGK
jgi:hypothetical protein